ncbi:MAG: CopD family protein, partial [Alphaproteobacteria bacterium]
MLGIAEFAAGILDGLLLVLLSIAVAAVPFGTVVLQATRRPPGDPGVARTGRLLARAAVGLALCQAALLGIKVFVLRSYLGAEAVPLFAATPQARAGLARLLVAAALGLVARRIAGRTDDPRRWSTAGLLAVAMLVAGAWLTHATSRLEDRGGLMALTVAHQAATGVWVGGVLLLALLWGRARVAASPADAAAFEGAVGRFWRLAIPAFALAVATGLPLTVSYLGSWQALVGSGPGSLLLGKLALVSLAGGLGGATFLAARGRPAGAAVDPAVGSQDAAFVSVEALLLVGALFTAAALASQPPAVDTTETHATLAEVATTFAPKWPTVRTPSVAAKLAATADPLAVVGWERTATAYSWSNFSHNVAGLVVLPMAILMLLAPRARWAR